MAPALYHAQSQTGKSITQLFLDYFVFLAGAFLRENSFLVFAI